MCVDFEGACKVIDASDSTTDVNVWSDGGVYSGVACDGNQL
jgi:hypothetical protein